MNSVGVWRKIDVVGERRREQNWLQAPEGRLSRSSAGRYQSALGGYLSVSYERSEHLSEERDARDRCTKKHWIRWQRACYKVARSRRVDQRVGERPGTH